MRRRLSSRGAFVVVVVVALLSSGVALAAHPFKDVSGGRFFSEPVDWAYNNGLTTGSPAGSDTFKPEDPVTRGENITFTYRYDREIVQPALGDRYTKAQVDAAIASATAGLYTKAQVDSLVASAVAGTATIPSGMTVTGNARYDQHETNAGADYWISVDFWGVAPAPLGITNVNFAPDGYAATTDDDPTCTGSVANPTAPAGKVCLYLDGVTGITSMSGVSAIPLGDRGFAVGWIAAGTGDMFWYASWAYTAP
jgi:hypothetical protein